MWFMKMKNSEKMDPNINFAVICNKQDLFLMFYLEMNIFPCFIGNWRS